MTEETKKKKRLFTGLFVNAADLGDGYKNMLKNLNIEAERRGFDVRWTPDESLHVTLNFMGHLNLEQEDAVKAVMQEVAQRHYDFRMDIKDIGAFPEIHHGRSIWLGVPAKRDLVAIQADLKETLKQSGFDLDDRQYIPHLTIARLRGHHSLKDLLSPFARKKFAKTRVEEITLFESRPKGRFSEYVPIYNVSLPRRPHDEGEDQL